MIRTARRMGQAPTNPACTNPVTTGCACLPPYVQAPNGVDECIISQAIVQQMVAAMTPAAAPAPVAIPAPVTPAQQVAAAAVTATTAAPANYAAAEIPGSFNYTADLETVSNFMSQLGDTWDNPQTVVNAMYAAGVAPGTVSQANALPYLTGITSAATATTTATGFTLPSLPWYAWAGIAAGGFLLLKK
jgi:hypothetical protein